MAREQIGSRLVFENAKAFIASNGYNVTQAVLTQSYIRSEVALSTSNAVYNLPLTVTSPLPSTPRNKVVQLQDIQVVSEIGFFLSLGTNISPLYTYPNVTAFPTGAAQFWLLYNAFFNLQINNQNVVPAIDIFRSLYVPQTQQGSGPVVHPSYDQYDMSSGFFAIEPNVLINGAANFTAQVVMPAAPSAVDAGSSIVMIMRTILAQNVTSVR